MVVYWQHAEAEIEIETRNNNNNILSTLLSPRGSLNLKLKREIETRACLQIRRNLCTTSVQLNIGMV